MKTLKFILLVIIGVSLQISCEKIKENKVPVEYLTTTLGGCNNNNYQRIYSEENDTVVSSITGDNIHIFVGINYTCSAPFETQCEIKNDTVFMYIIDTCKDIHECYERCFCYYTFDFVFKQGELNQEYKIVLKDPRKENPVIIEVNNFQNKIVVKKLGNKGDRLNWQFSASESISSPKFCA